MGHSRHPFNLDAAFGGVVRTLKSGSQNNLLRNFMKRTRAMSMNALREKRMELLDKADELLASENADVAEVQKLVTEAEAIGEKIKSVAETEARLKAVRNTPDNPTIRAIVNMGGVGHGLNDGHGFGSSGPIFRDANGSEIRAFGQGELLSKRPSDGRIGENLHNVLTGRITNANFGSSDANGGYLLTPEMSGMMIDLARANSVTMKAGALSIPMSTAELSLVKVTADPTPQWRSETQSITASTVSFGRLNFRARTLACLVPVSVELLEDAANAAVMLEQVIAAAIAVEMDRAGLYGDGEGAEPLGIKNTAGVNTVTSTGTPSSGAATWAKPNSALKSILTSNYNGDVSELSWIHAPRDYSNWNSLSDSTYQPLMMPSLLGKLQQYSTTSLPTTEGGGAESSAIIGHFPQLAYGMRSSGVVVQILDAGSVTDSDSVTWNAVDQMMRFIRVYIRLDVGLLRPSWFTVMSGITSA